MFWANVAMAVLCLAAAALQLLGCAEAPPDSHPPPDLGECVGFAARATDAGHVAHIYAYPDGYPCGDGGMCQSGVCEPDDASESEQGRARVR
jgi:hypothetical protein